MNQARTSEDKQLENASLKNSTSENNHIISPFLTYMREITYGGIDGIITTFAVVAGFAGAQANMSAIPLISVLVFGFANLFADATSMALGSFLSVRANQDAYENEKNRAKNRLLTKSEKSLIDTNTALKEYGFTGEDSHTLATIFAKNKTFWLDFKMMKELKIPNPENENPFYTSIVTFFAFVFFGFVPLTPYVFKINENNLFGTAVFFAVLALILLAFLRWKITKMNILRSFAETILIGLLSGSIAYFVGTFFHA